MSRSRPRGGRVPLVASALGAALLALACSEDRTAAGQPTAADGGPRSTDAAPDSAPRDGGGEPAIWEKPLEGITWEACPLFEAVTAADAGAPDAAVADAAAGAGGLPDVRAECATVSMPLRHAVGDAETIPYFVKRLRATAPRRGQLWLLSGGPGSDGSTMAYAAMLYARLSPDLDVYMPDHRGTGRSSRLDCDEARRLPLGGNAACVRELAREFADRLDAFRTTEAAHDVARVIHSTRAPGDRVIVHGASYGGYWLHRLIQVAPSALDAAVFESSARPIGHDSVTGAAADLEMAGRQILSQCAADPDCGPRLPSTDVDELNDLVNALESCSSLAPLDVAAVKTTLGDALLPFQTRRLIPAALRWVLSCTPEGTAWFRAFSDRVRQRSPNWVDRGSFTLGLHLNVAMSEIQGAPVEPVLLEALRGTWLFGPPTLVEGLSTLVSGYPAYAPDEFEGQWAETSLPLMIANGDHDAQTGIHLGLEIAERYRLPQQQFVRFPTGGHGVSFASHDYDDEISCGMHVLSQFHRDPSSLVDQSCVVATPPMDFRGAPELVREISGRDSAWDSPLPASP